MKSLGVFILALLISSYSVAGGGGGGGVLLTSVRIPTSTMVYGYPDRNGDTLKFAVAENYGNDDWAITVHKISQTEVLKSSPVLDAITRSLISQSWEPVQLSE